MKKGSNIADFLGELSAKQTVDSIDTSFEMVLVRIKEYVVPMINRKKIDTQMDLLTELNNGDDRAIFPRSQEAESL